MTKILTLFMILLALSSCGTGRDRELKSPCVAIGSDQPDSPCGPKRPANAAWMS